MKKYERKDAEVYDRDQQLRNTSNKDDEVLKNDGGGRSGVGRMSWGSHQQSFKARERRARREQLHAELSQIFQADRRTGRDPGESM